MLFRCSAFRVVPRLNRGMVATVSMAALLFSGHSTNAQTFTWKSVNIQGMGFVTGFSAHPAPPYDLYIRTDVGGAYRYDRMKNEWIPILDDSGIRHAGHYLVESIAADPTNARRVWVAVRANREFGSTKDGEVLVSDDRGVSWTPTGLAAKHVGVAPNGDWRGWCGERLVADPNRSGLLYFASTRDGLWRKMPGGQWQLMSGGLPAASALPGYITVERDENGNISNDYQLDDHPGYTFVAFDKSTATPGNTTRTIYVGAYGSGVWRSTNGGANWSNIGGGTNPVRATVASNGTLYASFGSGDSNASGAVKKYVRGAWQDVTPAQEPDKSYQGISVHPTDPNQVVVTRGDRMVVYRTTDGGSNWTRIANSTDGYGQPNIQVESEPEYFIKASETNFYLDACDWGSTTVLLDPARPERLWMNNGYGVVKTEDITAAATSWHWVGANLEELVVNAVKCPPKAGGADLLITAEDMPGFRIPNRKVRPTETLRPIDHIMQGNGFDYCYNQPDYCAFVGWDEWHPDLPFTGFSSNNGRTFEPFGSEAPGIGGGLAMSSTDPRKMVWSPSGWSPLHYTTNGGVTWQRATLVGGGEPHPTFNHANKYWAAQIVASDKVDGNLFYYYAQGVFYHSTDGGATWREGAIQWLQGLPDAWTIVINVVPNPAKSGEVWIAHHYNDNQPGPHPLFRSTDKGLNFARVTSVDSCQHIAFGRGMTPSLPFIYIHGRCNGDITDGIYKSADNGATWIRISDPASKQFGTISCLEGDMRYKNRVYVGTFGRGVFVGEAEPSGPTGAGYAIREVWNNVSGSAVSAIPITVAPSALGTVTGLEGPRDSADNFGARIRGFLTAPLTGSYTFWVAGDDAVEFYLSTDEKATNKSRVAYHRGVTAPREWNKYRTQKSAPRSLVKGQRYYFEVLHKQATGPDHVAVGWAKPGEPTASPREVVPGSQLSPR